MSLDQHLFAIQDCFRRGQPLGTLLSLNLKHAPHVATLQGAIQGVSDRQVSDQVSRLDLPSAGVEAYVEAYVRFVRDVDPWSLRDSLDLMLDVFQAFSIALNVKEPNALALLVPLLDEYRTLLIPLTKLVDEETMRLRNWHGDYPRLSFLSSALLKCINNIRSDPDIGLASNAFKVRALLEASIALCQVYFSINKHVLCANVFSNVNVLALDMSQIHPRLLLRYRFTLGKYHAQQASYLRAFHHLNWCYTKVGPKARFASHITILKYLLPVGLLVGQIPDTRYLQDLVKGSVSDPNGQAGRFFLTSMLPLIAAYKKGHLEKVMTIIHRNEDLWKRLGLWIGLVQRIRLLVMRNALLRAYHLNNKVLRIADVQICMQTSIGNAASNSLPLIYSLCETVNEYNAENLLATLVQNGLLKGKTSGTGSVIMSKDCAFPPLGQTYLKNGTLDPKEKWLDG